MFVGKPAKQAKQAETNKQKGKIKQIVFTPTGAAERRKPGWRAGVVGRGRCKQGHKQATQQLQVHRHPLSLSHCFVLFCFVLISEKQKGRVILFVLLFVVCWIGGIDTPFCDVFFSAEEHFPKKEGKEITHHKQTNKRTQQILTHSPTSKRF